MILHRIVPFNGTKEEAAQNYNTHNFSGEDHRCSWCDCKSWGTCAEYPCGVEPPREDVDTSNAEYQPGSALEALIVSRK